MASWRDTLKDIINTQSSRVYFDRALKHYSTFQIGGPAECLIIVNSIQDLINIIKFVNKHNLPLYTIGNGSKILFPSQTLSGITIKLGKHFNYIRERNQQIVVGAATPLSKIINFTSNHSLSGVEFLAGIPATLGGALFCNAGAFGHDIGSRVVTINGINNYGEEVQLTRKDLNFTYRQSNLQSNFIITEAILELALKDSKLIRQDIAYYLKYRQHAHPWGASVGSIFKNPRDQHNQTIPAGKLIEQAGLKKMRCGDAEVSSHHANFIINKKNARARDVYELIQIIKSIVELKYKIILQEEIQIFPKYVEVKKWQNQKEQ
ncbi:MAG: UDP-N-acetylmuramate dehydrogenase [candidate division WOR-3 bacterium]